MILKAIFITIVGSLTVFAQSPGTRKISGVVITHRNEAVRGVTIIAAAHGGERRAVSNDDGEFSLDVETADNEIRLRIEGQNIVPQQRVLAPDAASTNLEIGVDFLIPPIHQSIVITASALEPRVETYNDEIYKKTLFSRDDQLLESLNAGINAGQHEGGGKSLEVRRFGLNLDHGGVNGGLKVLVDDIQQNQVTQGHGQGYLGALKTVTPELIQDVNILNGPFSAEYGDFSGLGVVHLRLKENLRDLWTVRLQGGSFGSYRNFFSYSPELEKGEAFLAFEKSRSDGPFLNPSRYKRDNVTGNYTRHFGNDESLSFKLNFGRNDFYSSGQIPLDLVAAGELSRFGHLDPTNGGRARLGTTAVYYRKALKSGASFKADGFVSRSLFDLYSNFTFFLNDPDRGDGIQQHDSRYQEGFNTQYLRPHRLFGSQALFTAGTNFHDNQINVGLYPQKDRTPLGVTTLALAHVTNTAGYAQQGMDFMGGRLHVETGVRWDYFRFSVNSAVKGAAKLQPKLGLAYRPAARVPVTLSFNYGRGINTQDARGIVERPDSPRIATTDFYQLGAAYQSGGGRISISSDVFLIDRSNEQAYIPDDGTFELKGPSRSYGYEGKASIRITRHVAFNGGVTQVSNSFYRSTAPRLYVDSAPHTVINGGLTLTTWKNLYASLRYRHVGNYRLDGLDPTIRASGLDVADLSITKSLRRTVDLSIEIDNLTGKRYYETQNYFESRVTPLGPAMERIHGTSGYPRGVTVGLTFHLGAKTGS
jgi:hypothetical protein